MPSIDAVHVNECGQPVGRPLVGWEAPARPGREVLQGRFCRVEPLEMRHAGELYAANSRARDASAWTYLPYGPFPNEQEYREWMLAKCFGPDPLFYAIVMPGRGAAGVASYLRIDPPMGCIEVGHLNFSTVLQRTPAATEAMFLMMEYAFALGYRRYEWKCDSLNAPSRAAALRLGFIFEGIFRNAVVYKGRNRDTAWYSITDDEWPARRAAFERWLDPANFDEAGQQRQRLAEA